MDSASLSTCPLIDFQRGLLLTHQLILIYVNLSSRADPSTWLVFFPTQAIVYFPFDPNVRYIFIRSCIEEVVSCFSQIEALP